MAMTKSVLIIGGSGFVGTQLALRMRDQFKVFITYHKHPTRIAGVTSLPLSTDNRDWSKRIAYLAKPDTIIYAAGSNNVVAAETDPRVADNAHVGGPATIADVADILQPKFIYLSNCFVFDGSRGNYHEPDIALPYTALGKSKLGGENFVRGRSLNYLIVRSSPLIGRGNGLSFTFFDRVRASLDRGERLELPNHENFSFVPISCLADMLIRVIEGGARNRVLHFGGLTKLTHYEWATQFAQRFNYDPRLIVPSHTNGTKKDYSLNCTQATQMLKLKPLLIQESFDLIDQELVPSF